MNYSDRLIAVNAMYPTFQGESNRYGMGAPVIFLRLQGCHIRCYVETLGVLCDTPEALERDDSKGITVGEIIKQLNQIRYDTGIGYVCLSGGDPLWRKREDIRALLLSITAAGFEVSVETSGTLSIAQYKDIPEVYWVLDYKLLSAGIKNTFCYEDLPLLNEFDFIKFVVKDEADYQQLLHVVPDIFPATKAKLAVGPYWGGDIRTLELFSRLQKDHLLEKVTLNVQLHKMATFVDFNDHLINSTEIPKLL
jgi:organic radical activating enzyme